ncbi:MAG: hypothetical protein ACTSXQ_00345 [Alphaproteobacteria bacterium]
MAPSGVNNAAREVMAAMRRQFEDAQWFNYGDTLTYLSPTSFSVVGDLSALYEAGRRIKLTGATPFTVYGDIVSAVYSAPDTIITVTLDSGALDASLSAASLSILTPGNVAIPSIFTGGDNASYPSLSVTAGRALQVNDAYKVLNVEAGSDITLTVPTAPYLFMEGQTFLVSNIGSTGHNVTIQDGNGAGKDIVLENDQTAYFVSLSDELRVIYDTRNDGEKNTASNLGTSADGDGLATEKSLIDLPFKRLKAGSNVTLTPSTNSIEISTDMNAALTEAYESPEQFITYDGALTLAHGLSSVPKLFQLFMVCKIAEGGWAIDDEFPLYSTFQITRVDTLYQGLAMNADGTNIYGRFGHDIIAIMQKGTGYYFNIDSSNWRVIVRAWA